MKKITKIFSSILLALPVIASGCGNEKNLYGPAPSVSCEKDADCKSIGNGDYFCNNNKICEQSQNQNTTLYGPPADCAGQDKNYCNEVFAKGWNKEGNWYCNKDGECAQGDASSDAGSDN